MSDSPYTYSEAIVPGLVAALSTERFETYLVAAGGANTVGGLQRYMWNAAIAAKFHGPLHVLEVTLRNAIHGRMSDKYGGNWFDLGHLGGPEMRVVTETRDFLVARNCTPTPGKVVAELPLHFWVGLFAMRHNPLWKSDLGRLFTPRIDRNDVHEDLDRLRTLRNRIAHHEPILNRRLMDDMARIDRLVSALSPAMGDWLRWHHRVDVAFGTPPDKVCTF